MAEVANWDRVKASLFALARAANPRAIYSSVYRGVVVAQRGQTVDVTLDDPRLPGMSALSIQVGLPGATVDMDSGARMLVAFENGDPAKPIALLWEGAKALRVSLVADLLELGVEGATEAVLLATTYRAAEATLHSTLEAQLAAAGAGLAAAGAAATHSAAQPGLAAAGAALAAAVAALAAFEGQAATFLSSIVRTG